MSYKLAQLNLPAGSRKNQAVGDIFVAQPDTVKESLAGKLFIVISLENGKNQNVKAVNFLIDNLNHNYYQNDKILLRERISTLRPEHIFETALAKTNNQFREFAKSEKLKIDLNCLNITAGIIYRQTLHFANTGKNKILLLYPHPSGTGPEGEKHEYKVSNIAAEKTGPASGGEERKIFTNVLSGELPSKSYVLVANEAVPEYITEKKLVEVITTLPPVGAIEQIKNLLSGVNSYIAFQALLLKSGLAAEKEPARPARAGSQNSIYDLNAAENTTERILEPSSYSRLKKWAGLAIFRKKGEPGGSTQAIVMNDNIYARKKSSGRWQKAKASSARNLLAVLNIFTVLFRRAKAGDSFKPLAFAKKTPAWCGRLGRSALGLDWQKKTLLLVAIGSIALLAINVIKGRNEQEQAESREKYQEVAELIEKKQHQAEASLLYSNEENAQKLFAEITGLMEQLPQVTEEQQTAYNDFKNRLELQLEKANRVARIDDGEVLVDLVDINPQAKPENIIFLPESENILMADPADKSIYIIDTGDNTVTVAAELNLEISSLAFPALGTENSVYYFNDNTITLFQGGQETMRNLEINLLGDGSQFAAADVYSGRYYLLNRENNQIYRYSRSGNGFTPPYAWIQEDIDLGKAIDIAIDGHIYILLDNGEMLKLLRGLRVDFKLEKISPPLEQPTAALASLDQKYLYILEPAGSRLVLYDKSGQFIRQYKADFIKDAAGFAINEAEKQMYFLTGTKVYRAEAEHLEETDQ